MTFRIEKKVKKSIYLYDVTSRWDKKEKKYKKTFVYVGKKDNKTGETVEKVPRQKPKIAEDFGPKYLFSSIIQKLKLDELLKKHFPDTYLKLIEIIIFQLTESKPSYLMEYTFSDEEIAKQFSSQVLSEIFHELGKSNKDNIASFLNDWMNIHKEQDALFYDISSISSYSKYIDDVEYGYNRDGDSLPQINFGILYGTSSELPILYKNYPGSINDVSTLKNINKELSVYGLKDFTFILDRGFFSAKNLNLIYKDTFDVIIPMSFSLKEAKILSEKKIDDLSNLFSLSGSAIYNQTFETKIGENIYQSHVYQIERRKSIELDLFTHKIAYYETLLLESTLKKKEDLLNLIDETCGEYSKYFEVTKYNKKDIVTKNLQEMQKAINKMGKVVLLTKKQYEKKETPLKNYRLRDSVEKVFDVMKNEINENRLRISSNESMDGRLFINFLVLIGMAHVTKIMKDAKLFKNFTINEVIHELKRIKIITMYDGTKYLCELTKKQKDLFDKFGIKHPEI